jgi:5-oxopent-3-ene-1,2,5-tricarboxylate decarboxylase/2-hydroxyhepta-2,4-diene-1,7-dioate isomerase
MPRWLLPLGALAPVHNVDNLTIITEINGEADSWNTGDLQRNAAELLSALSEFATLNPGDAILIGTPTPASRCARRSRADLAEGFRRWKTRLLQKESWHETGTY